MNICHRIAGCAALVAVTSTPALAAPKLVVQPVQIGQESLRYYKSVPTVDLEMKDGVVQITPLELDHGSLSFGIAVYNDTWTPANFDVSNIRVTYDGELVKVFTRDDLGRQAKRRAFWSSMALAAVGGLAAGLAASQRSHYRGTLVTPRGQVYRSYVSAPSASGQFQASAISAGTGIGIGRVRSQLDRTLEDLREEIVQLTTVDAGQSYAGRIILAKIEPKTFPALIEIRLMWNGETYPFAFQMAKPGTVAPTFVAVSHQSNLTHFAGGQPSPLARPQAHVTATQAPVRAVDARKPGTSATILASADHTSTGSGLVSAAPNPAQPWGLVSVTPAGSR